MLPPCVAWTQVITVSCSLLPWTVCSATATIFSRLCHHSQETGREIRHFFIGGWKWMGSLITLAQIYFHRLATTTETSGNHSLSITCRGSAESMIFLPCPVHCLQFSPRFCLSSLHLQTPDGSKFFRHLSISDPQLNSHSGTPVTVLSISLLWHSIRQTSKCEQ